MSSWITRTPERRSSVTSICSQDAPILCGLKGECPKIRLGFRAAPGREVFRVSLTYFKLQAITATPLHGTSGTGSWRCSGEYDARPRIESAGKPGHSPMVHLTDDFSWQASVVGKRLGRNRWSPSNQKTGEGSIAFTLSVALSALFLRLLGLTEEFSVSVFTMSPVFRSRAPACCGAQFSRSSSTLLMAMILGFQVHRRRRTLLAAGGIFCAERQFDITRVPLERGSVGCSVGIFCGVGDLKLQE